MRCISLLITGAALVLTTSSGWAAPAPQTAAGYTVLGTDLAKLRQDFNADAGKVRLLYIVGPSCPVCLRGMDELGKSLSAQQDDPRLRTLVVSVPELGAKAADIEPTASLLPGKYVSRYWDPTQTSEKVFEAQLKTPGLAWDVWMVYGPAARWDSDTPPQPDFWMAQMAGLPPGRYLDDEEFSKRVLSYLVQVKTGTP